MEVVLNILRECRPYNEKTHREPSLCGGTPLRLYDRRTVCLCLCSTGHRPQGGGSQRKFWRRLLHPNTVGRTASAPQGLHWHIV